MPRKIGAYSYQKGYRRDIMRMLLTSGVITYNGLKLWSKNKNQYVRYQIAVKDLVEEDEVIKSRLDGQVIVRLSKAPKNYFNYQVAYGLVGNNPIAEKNRKQSGKDSDKAKQYNSMRAAEVYMMLNAIGVDTYPSMQKDIDFFEEGDVGYFPAQEVRRFTETKIDMNEKEQKENLGTRSLGLLISQGGNYLTYHAGKGRIRCNKRLEEQMRLLTNRMLYARNFKEKSEMVLFGYDDGTFLELFRKHKDKNILDASYPQNDYPMYMIPYTEEGKEQLKKMTTQGWKSSILGKWRNDNCIEETLNESIDGKDRDGRNCLCFAIPDLRKLQRFLINAEWSEKDDDNIVYCYDFQKPFLEQLKKEKQSKIKIQEIKKRIE